MIICNRKYLIARCIERGYTLTEVMPCVIEQNGDIWTIDEEHSAYPKKNSYENYQNIGPGTELKKILSTIGIYSKVNCGCNSKAKIMNVRGIEWCEKNIDKITGWLREEARKRNLPFVETIAKILIKKAISNAKKKSKQ